MRPAKPSHNDYARETKADLDRHSWHREAHDQRAAIRYFFIGVPLRKAPLPLSTEHASKIAHSHVFGICPRASATCDEDKEANADEKNLRF